MTSPSSESLKAEIGGGETSEGAVVATDQISLYRGVKKAKRERGCTAKERISKMPPCAAGKRSSIYRGVTRYIDIYIHTCAKENYYLEKLNSDRKYIPKTS